MFNKNLKNFSQLKAYCKQFFTFLMYFFNLEKHINLHFEEREGIFRNCKHNFLNIFGNLMSEIN